MRIPALTGQSSIGIIGQTALLALFVLATVGIGGGCGEDSPTPPVKQDVGTVAGMRVGAPTLSAESGLSTLTFPVWFGEQERQVELRASAEEWVARILDRDVLGYELHWRSDGTGWEQTAFERLDIAIVEEGSVEEYRYTDLLSGVGSSMVVTASTTEEQWAGFYDPYTLNDNPEGERLARVLTAPLVVEMLAPYCEPNGRADKKPTDAERICRVAGTLGTLKCMFGGGAANPLCHVAIGVTFVCGVMYLVQGEA